MRIHSVSTDSSSAGVVKVIALTALVLTGCIITPSGGAGPTRCAGAQPAPGTVEPGLQPILADPSAVNPNIPTPASIIGHDIGDGAVRYEPAVRYLQALAQASPLVRLTPYAETHEGRTLYYLTITSAANHTRLDRIKADNAKLADPRRLSPDESGQEADTIIENLPGVAWLAYSIHGDELSSTDAALMVAYQLAAGTDAHSQILRDELVIHIDPLMNPDGRERYLRQLQNLTGKVPNPDYQAMQHRGLWSAGRGNHYLFDLNRDWLMQVHPETRGRAAQILGWNPHLVVDSHEMGSLDTYLFDPPREPFNTELSEKNLQWRRRFSADQAKAFDRHGWSYYTQEWYEEWYPGYTNAWASLLGAVGLLYEQAGVNAAAVKQQSGQTLTYREAVHHHFVSSMANLETLRANRREIIRDFYNDRAGATGSLPARALADPGAPGPVAPHRSPDAKVFLLPPLADQARVVRLIELLDRQGIETAAASQPFEASDVVDIWGDKSDTMTFAAGTLVVRSAQPHRRLLQAILGFDPHMSDEFLNEERTELENRRGTRLYDTTAWNLPMAYGLEAYWAGRISAVELTSTEAPQTGVAARHAVPLPSNNSGYGYLIEGANSDVYRMIVRLLDSDCKVRCAVKPFTFSGQAYKPGSVLLRNRENPADLPRLMSESAAGLNLGLRAVDTALSEEGPDLGGQRFRLLTQPRIAITSQWPIATTSFGSTWHLLDDKMQLRASPINIQNVGSVDLRKYNVIVLPHARSSGALSGILNDGVRKSLKRWIESGGTLIALGGSAAFLANKDRGLSAVRAKRDVLDQLEVYQEAIKRERAAREVKVDPDQVWGTGEGQPGEDQPPQEGARGAGSTGPAGEKEKEGDKKTAGEPKPKAKIEALKREDAWRRIFAPRGTFVATALDPEHWLCFGLGAKLPVWISGSYALMSKHPVQTPVRLAKPDELRLSGLLWPEARERWANTAYATVERVGRGQIILFATDPFYRGYMEGTGRLLLNALILGPGLGTSQPVPW